MRPVPVAFHVGPLVVHTYGIGLAITFWLAYRYFERRLRARGYETRWVLGMFVWVVVAAIVGARAMHVLANLSYYRSAPLQVFQVWHGGLSSWGGLLLAVPTGVVVTRRRYPALRLGAAMDVVAPVLAAVWAIGRLLGPQLMVAGGGHPTHQWFGMYYADQVGKRLPVPVFQAIEDAAIFCVLLYVEHRLERAADARSAPRTHPAGALIGTAMLLWGIERVLDEKLWLSYPGQLGDVLVEAAGIALAVAGIVLLAVTRRRWQRWASAGDPTMRAGPVTSAGSDPGAPPGIERAHAGGHGLAPEAGPSTSGPAAPATTHLPG
ncbi:MAG: prolipoprotein diacylglyceryl transferase [Acidimicrobiales bacterium]